jgi:hypothetical protein
MERHPPPPLQKGGYMPQPLLLSLLLLLQLLLLGASDVASPSPAAATRRAQAAGGACGDLDARTAAVNSECCDEATEDCSSGRPATCNLDCAHVLLPFFEDCAAELGAAVAALFDDVVALCRAAEAEGQCAFRATMDNSHSCSGMRREHSAESSRAACRAWCCGQGERCNAYVWHVGAGQCWVSPSPVDPVAQCSRTHGDPPAWVGETRHPGPPPPPPPPPRREWNTAPGLVPPHGMWRGATIDNRFAPPVPGGTGSTGGAERPAQQQEPAAEDGILAFQRVFSTRLHIYRGFKTPSWTEITPSERNFIAAGGILFYSIQPSKWSEWVGGQAAAQKIRKFADAIKSVAPAQVMVAPGYEPDGHAAESQRREHLVYGSAAEYRQMFLNFRREFALQKVTNAVFVLDLSSDVRSHPSVFSQLYAGDEQVDWVFFNLFQSHKQSPPLSPVGATKGNCSTMAEELYAVLGTPGVINDAQKPWGLGAWGTMNSTFGDPADGYPAQPIPTADRRLCLEQMMAVLANREEYGRLKAAIYFDSLNSLISPDDSGSTPWPSAELAPTLQRLLHLPVFSVND